MRTTIGATCRGAWAGSLRRAAAILSIVVGSAFALGAPAIAVPDSVGLLAGGLALIAAGGLVRWSRRGIALGDDTARGLADPDALAALLDHCGEAVAILDPSGSLTYANATFMATFGSVASLADLAEVLDPSTAEDSRNQLGSLTSSAVRIGSGEVVARGGRIYGWTSEPVRDTRGCTRGRLLLLYDRTQERELAALKSDVLSTVTHELRTPLTAVKGALQLVLGKSAALTPIDRELLNISLKNSDRLIRMINDLLDISRLELGRLTLSFTTVPSGALVDEVVAGLGAYAGGRDIVLASELPPNLPAIHGDRDRLIQVLTNLVSNAIKFSPPGGRVLVQARGEGASIAISVRDWGVGICASDQGRLFRRFQRLNRARSDEPGAGLGLAISKAIVDRHDGRIRVASCEGEGSVFTVLLPAVAAAPSLPTLGHPVERAPSAARHPTLLLIDDDTDLGRLLETSFGQHYRVLRVARGVDALDVARVERPHVILLDVGLPDLSGYDVLRILRHGEVTHAIPVVMMTAQPERELAARLGAVEVVTTPVDIDDLHRVLMRVLRGAAHMGRACPGARHASSGGPRM